MKISSVVNSSTDFYLTVDVPRFTPKRYCFVLYLLEENHINKGKMLDRRSIGLPIHLFKLVCIQAITYSQRV